MVDLPQSPQPYDLVQLHPDNRFGIPTATVLIIADTVDGAPDLLEVWHLDTHPAHLDWAAAVTLADIARIAYADDTTGIRTWTPNL